MAPPQTGGTNDAGYGAGYGAVSSFHLLPIPEASSGLLALLGMRGFNSDRRFRRRRGRSA